MVAQGMRNGKGSGERRKRGRGLGSGEVGALDAALVLAGRQALLIGGGKRCSWPKSAAWWQARLER